MSDLLIPLERKFEDPVKRDGKNYIAGIRNCRLGGNIQRDNIYGDLFVDRVYDGKKRVWNPQPNKFWSFCKENIKIRLEEFSLPDFQMSFEGSGRDFMERVADRILSRYSCRMQDKEIAEFFSQAWEHYNEWTLLNGVRE